MMVVFGSPPRVEAFSLFFGAIQAAVPDFALPQDSPLFSLQDSEKLRREMGAAGLDDIRVETVDHVLEIQSATQLWDMLTSAAPATEGLVANLSDAQKAAVKGKLGDMLRQRFGDGAAALNMQVHVGIGTK